MSRYSVCIVKFEMFWFGGSVFRRRVGVSNSVRGS